MVLRQATDFLGRLLTGDWLLRQATDFLGRLLTSKGRLLTVLRQAADFLCRQLTVLMQAADSS